MRCGQVADGLLLHELAGQWRKTRRGKAIRPGSTITDERSTRLRAAAHSSLVNLLARLEQAELPVQRDATRRGSAREADTARLIINVGAIHD